MLMETGDSYAGSILVCMVDISIDGCGGAGSFVLLVCVWVLYTGLSTVAIRDLVG